MANIKSRLNIAALALLMAGCTTTQLSDGIWEEGWVNDWSITALRLQNQYPNAEIWILDMAYKELSRDAVLELYNTFQNHLFERGVTQYAPELFDCENFAEAFIYWVNVNKALEVKGVEAAVGLLCYNVGGEEFQGHAINVVFMHEGEFSRVVELEPQFGGGIVELTEAERESAWLIIM